MNRIKKIAEDVVNSPPFTLNEDVKPLIENIDEIKEMHDSNFVKINAEQCEIYRQMTDNVNNTIGRIIFVYGSGGCEKIFQ